MPVRIDLVGWWLGERTDFDQGPGDCVNEEGRLAILLHGGRDECPIRKFDPKWTCESLAGWLNA